MQKVKELSAFFPAYNEQENLEHTVRQADAVLKQIAQVYEIIIVNDGSRDKTGEIAKMLAKENATIKVITHQSNLGYGSALRSGFYGARYELIIFSDSDGQFDFSEATRLIDAIDNADLVIGYRIKRMDPPIRSFIAWGWKVLIWLFLGLKVRDVDCAFKLIRKDVLQTIPTLTSTRGGMISPEIIIKAKKAGFRIKEVGVNHFPRRAGKPNGVSIGKIVISFYELIKLALFIRLLNTAKQIEPNKNASVT